MSAREWLIRKGGYYYRSDRSGYTTSPHDAGRYTEQEARAEASIEPGRMSAIHERDAKFLGVLPTGPVGYRLLAPGELDPATIERCQAEVEIACEANASDHDKIRFIRKRLRSLKGGENG